MQAVQVTITAFLARLLTPDDFGLVAIAGVFTGLAAVVGEWGLGAAIIQRKEVDQARLSTSFWFSFGSGGVWSVLLLWGADWIGRAMGQEALAPVVRVLAVGCVIGALGTVHRALLNKHLHFKRMALSEVMGVCAWGITALWMAWRGWGVWSLVVGELARGGVSTVAVWTFARWWPSWVMAWRGFRSLFSFGAQLTGGSLVNYGATNIDYFFIGKFLGSEALGYYSLAYRLTTYPQVRLSTVIARVVFPVLARVNEEDELLRRGYLSAVGTIALLVFPLIAGLFVLAGDLVKVLWGTPWEAAVLPLKILCVVGALKGIGTTVGLIFLAKGRADIHLKWNGFAFGVVSVAVLLGVSFGVAGVASAMGISTLVLFLICQAIANRLIGLRFGAFFRTMKPALMGALGMGVVVGMFAWVSRPYLSATQVLVLGVLVGVVSYAWLVGLLRRGIYREVREVFLQHGPEEM